MHKKLEAELISLAHSILKLKNKEDVFALKELSKEVYEKLSMLAFVEQYVRETPNLEVSKEELLAQVEVAFDKKKIDASHKIEEQKVVEETPNETEEETIVYNLLEEVEDLESLEDEIEEVVSEKTEAKKEEVIEQPFEELENLMFGINDTATNFKNDVKDVGSLKTPTLEDELQDTISVDIMADLFESAKPQSLNDQFAKNIQIGLNDRITFVKNLFNGEQENFNRVVSQLNTFKTEKEAKKFINKMVKPDYNWSEQEELETRFMQIIERKFS